MAHHIQEHVVLLQQHSESPHEDLEVSDIAEFGLSEYPPYPISQFQNPHIIMLIRGLFLPFISECIGKHAPPPKSGVGLGVVAMGIYINWPVWGFSMDWFPSGFTLTDVLPWSAMSHVSLSAASERISFSTLSSRRWRARYLSKYYITWLKDFPKVGGHCMYVCMHVCVCVCMFMYICMYVCMYVCVCVYVCIYVCMYVCTYVHMYVCMYVYMYVCIYVCMYVCMYICMYVCKTFY